MCIRDSSCTVSSATAETIAVTYEVFVPTGRTEEEIEALVEDALADFFRDVPIGGTVLPGDPTGYVFVNALEAAIFRAVPEAVQVEVTAPAADVALTSSEVAVLSTITPTVTFTS